MSGQFEQRRLARPSYQLAVLDAFCGEEQLRRRAEARVAWRELGAARRRLEELTRDAAAGEARLAELRALVEDTDGTGAGPGGRAPRGARASAASDRAAGGNRGRRGGARPGGRRRGGRAHGAAPSGRWRPVERLAPELQKAADELRDAELRLREAASALRSFLLGARGRPGPAGGGRVATRADRRRQPALPVRLAARSCSPAPPRRGPSSWRSTRASIRSQPPRRRSNEPRRVYGRSPAKLHEARAAAAGRFAEAVAGELQGMGMGDGEFTVELSEREPGASGTDEAVFLIRPNAGLPFGAGGRDRVRRRALPRRARDRRGRRRRDDGLRRDRRRHRRDDRPRRRRDARRGSPAARR